MRVVLCSQCNDNCSLNDSIQLSCIHIITVSICTIVPTEKTFKDILFIIATTIQYGQQYEVTQILVPVCTRDVGMIHPAPGGTFAQWFNMTSDL